MTFNIKTAYFSIFSCEFPRNLLHSDVELLSKDDNDKIKQFSDNI